MLSGASILVTGASRGLGLELVRQLVARTPVTGPILATCRCPEAAAGLREVAAADQLGRVHVLQLDVNATDSYAVLKSQLANILQGRGLNFLINNAGVAPKSTRINLVDRNQMMTTFETNVVGPLLLTQSLLPLLTTAGKESGKPAVVVNLSSILGSIEENTSQGGLYPYRTSKAALNAVTRSLSIDLRAYNICSVSIHPGWVRTEMGGPNAPLAPPESVSGMLTVLDTFRPEQNGNFYDYTGQPISW